MKTDRTFAALAFLCLVGFLGVLAWFVPHPDLIAVVSIVLLMVVYDLWTELRVPR